MKRILQTVIQGALKKKGLRLVRHIDEDERCLQAEKLPRWFSRRFYDEIHQEDVPVPSLFTDLVYSKQATTAELALENLENMGLARYVSLISGNFIKLDHGTYDPILCDATHEPNEIRINLPHIVERSARNCVWALHDMNRENIALVLRRSDHDRNLNPPIPSLPHGIGAVQPLGLALRRPPVESNVQRGPNLLPKPG